MSEERRRILDMLAQGRITAAEAEQLLDAVGAGAGESHGSAPDTQARAERPRFLRVVIDKAGYGESGKPKQVSVRVPLSAVRAGMQLAAILPCGAGDAVTRRLKERGI
jgi:hypothetical protein